MSVFQVGALVKVNMPDGWLLGKIAEEMPNYGWTGETKFLVQGFESKPFETICSTRSMRFVSNNAKGN
jgi:hypothetical protein